MTAKLPKNNQQTIRRKWFKTVEVWAMGRREDRERVREVTGRCHKF